MHERSVDEWTEALRAREGRHRLVSPGPRVANEQWWVGVGRSLATFQLGESGGGRHIAAAAIAAGRTDLLEPLALFVREEQEHARLLGLVLDLGEVDRIGEHWTDGAFVDMRHIGGLRTELLTLLVAEIVGFQYYAALADSAPTPALRSVFSAIRDDEALHFAFLISVMNSLFAGWSRPRRTAALGVFRVVADASAVVMAIDHRHALGTAGISPARFVTRCWDLRRSLIDRLSGSIYPELLSVPHSFSPPRATLESALPH